MKFKSPQFLKSIPFPDCIHDCIHPALCHDYCEEKMKDEKSKCFVVSIIAAVMFASGMFLLMMSFKA